MLHSHAQFPYPGSTARFEQVNYRVISLNNDGTATLSSDAPGASGSRRAPVDQLTDPNAVQLNDEGLAPCHARTLRWLHDQLLTANRLVFQDMRRQIHIAAEKGDTPTVDEKTLCGLLRRLGWRFSQKLTTGGTIWERSA